MRPVEKRSRSSVSVSSSWALVPGLCTRTSRRSEFAGIGPPYPPAGSRAPQAVPRASRLRSAGTRLRRLVKAEEPIFFMPKLT